MNLIEVHTLQLVFQVVASSSCIVVGHQTFLAFSENKIFSLFFVEVGLACCGKAVGCTGQ